MKPQPAWMLAGWIACALVAATAARAETIFTESFETPAVTGNETAGNLYPGAMTLDNPVTVGGTPNNGGFVGRVVDGNSGGLDVAATHGGQAVIYGFGGASRMSLTWQVAAANTLVNGSTLTITYDVASLFAPATGEMWNVIFSGGASATFSASLSAADAVDAWRQDQFQTAVTDSSQPVTLQIVATRASSASDDFAFDNIVIDGTFITGDSLALADPLVDELSITRNSADASVTLSNGPADVTLFRATSDYGTNLADWQNNGSSSALGNRANGSVNGSLGGLTPDTICTEEEYYLEFSDDGGDTFSPLATFARDTTSYTHSGLSESTVYQYRILAYSSASGDSAWSDVADATTPVRPPFVPTVTADFDFKDNLIPAVFDTIPYGSGPATGGGVPTFDGTTAIQANTATIYGGTAPAGNFIYEVIVTHSALDSFDIAAGIVDATGLNKGSFLYHEAGRYRLIEAGEGAFNGTIDRARFSTFTGSPFDPSFLLTAAPAADFAAWINGFSVTDKSFTGDPDRDGLANGLEDFLGTDPGAWNAGLTEVSFDGTSLAFQHPQNESPASDVTGSYEWSPDLVTWCAGDGSDGLAGGPTVNIPAVVPVGGIATVTATASEPLNRLFVRAKAVQDP